VVRLKFRILFRLEKHRFPLPKEGEILQNINYLKRNALRPRSRKPFRNKCGTAHGMFGGDDRYHWGGVERTILSQISALKPVMIPVSKLEKKPFF